MKIKRNNYYRCHDYRIQIHLIIFANEKKTSSNTHFGVEQFIFVVPLLVAEISDVFVFDSHGSGNNCFF